MYTDIETIKNNLKKTLNKKRYDHTLGVSYTAACLAMRYECDTQKALIAGLLHDNAKCIDDEEMLNKCRKYNIEITSIEQQQPYLLHAKLGAFYVSKKYKIDDCEIAEAIKCHTTGKPEMNMLEKIIFVADYIEPLRDKAHNLKEIRKMSFVDIDFSVYMILNDTINYLKNNNKLIDDTSLKTYMYYKKLINERENDYEFKRKD